MANWYLKEKTTTTKTTTFSSQKHEKGEMKKSRRETGCTQENQVLAKSGSYKECFLKNLGVKAVYQQWKNNPSFCPHCHSPKSP